MYKGVIPAWRGVFNVVLFGGDPDSLQSSIQSFGRGTQSSLGVVLSPTKVHPVVIQKDLGSLSRESVLFFQGKGSLPITVL